MSQSDGCSFHATKAGYRDGWPFSNPDSPKEGTRVTDSIAGITADDNPTFQIGNHGNVPWNYHVGQIKVHDDSSPNIKIPGGLRYFFSDVGSANPISYLRDARSNTLIGDTVNVAGTIPLPDHTFTVPAHRNCGIMPGYWLALLLPRRFTSLGSTYAVHLPQPEILR